MCASLRLLIVIALLAATVMFTMSAQANPHGVQTGEPSEMYVLGVMYDEGLGVEVDGRRAYDWYRRAAKRGHAESMNRLGVLFLRGRGVPLNAGAALAWFRRAAAKASSAATNNLAMLYFYGLGVHQSYSQSARLLKQSAGKGDADAQNKLGGMYDDGLGVARDPLRAKALYLKSASQGYAPAIVNLARMLSQEDSASTRDIFPYPLLANPSIGIQPALLGELGAGSPEPRSPPEARERLILGNP